MLNNEIYCVNYKNSKVIDCDAVFILSTKRSDIELIKKRLKTNKNIYTCFDIYKYVNCVIQEQ